MGALFVAMILFISSVDGASDPDWSARIADKCNYTSSWSNTDWSMDSIGKASFGFFAYLGFLLSAYLMPDQVTRHANLSLMQRMAWLIVFIVISTPTRLFRVNFNFSGYSVIATMILGNFNYDGSLMFLAFGLSEYITFKSGLFGSSNRKKSLTSNPFVISKLSPELTLFSFSDDENF